MQSFLAANTAALARQLGVAPGLTDVAPVASTSDNAIGHSWLDTAVPRPAPEVIIGIGLCRDMSLEAIERIAPAARLVLLEPVATDAARALGRRSWTGQIDDGHLTVAVGPDYAGLSAIARVVPNLRRAALVVHPSIAQQEDLMGHAKDALAKLAFQSDANANARRSLSGRYLLHTLMNAPAVARESDAGRLANVFAGRPAVIAAAGPSLDRNLHDLGAVLDRALIIGCDTAAWPLVSAGISPHLVVAVDASEANARHLASFPSGKTSLVAEASVHPSALQSFVGRTFFFKVSDHEPWPWLASLGLDRVRLDAWGSVATTAFALALEMGCNPIIFAGADFAFTDGRPYCRGTSFEPIWASWIAGGQTYEDIWAHLVGKWPTVEDVGLDGRPVLTAPHLIAFRDWIAERAASRPDRRIVNMTGAGLLRGDAIEIRSATETLGAAAPLDAAAIVHALRLAHSSGVMPAALSPLLAYATSIAAGADDGLVARWRTFTEDTVSPELIRAAVTSTEQRAWALGASAFRQLMEAS